jgi:hypothetical protein
VTDAKDPFSIEKALTKARAKQVIGSNNDSLRLFERVPFQNSTQGETFPS